MTSLEIVCYNCQRSWQQPAQDPNYLQLDLATRPCPSCGGYTLGCRATPTTTRSGSVWQSWLRRQIAAAKRESPQEGQTFGQHQMAR